MGGKPLLSAAALLSLLALLSACTKPNSAEGEASALYTYLSGPDMPVQKVTYREIDGYAVTASDIILSKVEQAEKVRLLKEGMRAATALDPAVYVGYQWPDGIVHYEIERSMDRQPILDAMKHIQTETGVKFIPVPAGHEGGFIRFVPSSGCASYVGYMGPGGQDIMLNQSGCDTSAVIHEIFHALGFFHEQQRQDRDKHVVIRFDRIPYGWQDQYALLGPEAKTLSAYDFFSISHYPPYLDGQLVMWRKGLSENDPKARDLGQGRTLSAMDIAAINKLYPKVGALIPKIPEQDIPHGKAIKTVSLDIPAAELSKLTLEVSVIDYSGLAYDLDRQYKFDGAILDYGSQKFFMGANYEWFALQSDGSLFRWSNGKLLGTFDKRYFDQPSLLIDAPTPTGAPATATLSGDDNTITLKTLAYSGSFRVQLSATDPDKNKVVRDFIVNTTNEFPVVEKIADREISHRSLPYTVNLAASDADPKDNVRFEATVVNLFARAKELDDKYKLDLYYSLYNNQVWIYGTDYQPFYLTASGGLHRGTDNVKLSQLSPDFFRNPLWLLDARAATTEVTPAVTGTQLKLNSTGTAQEATYLVEVTALDDYGGKGHEDFLVKVTAGAPVIDAIANQAMHHSQDRLTVSFKGSDPDGDPISYTVSVRTLAEVLMEEHQLDPSTLSDGGDVKWIYGKRGWYMIRASDGALVIYDTNTVVTTAFGRGLYSNPDLLLDPQPVSVSASVTGNQLMIDPPTGFTGVLVVTLTGKDSTKATVSRSFNLAVNNRAPVLAAIGNQKIARGGKVRVTLSASDPDGEDLGYSVEVRSMNEVAYEIKTRYKLIPGTSDGGTVKWVQNEGGYWYSIDSTGRFKDQSNVVLATLTPEFFVNPDLLVLATEAAPSVATFSLDGNVVELEPLPSFAGTLEVTAAASDGALASTRRFLVTVTNEAPVLDPVANRTVTRAQLPLAITLTAKDADGHSLTYSGEGGDVASLAYQLDQQWGFYSVGGDYDSESYKWFMGTGGEWFMIDTAGVITRYSNNTVVATLTPAYFVRPELVFDAAPPASTPALVSVSGNVLTLNARAGFTGMLYMTARASDGAAAGVRTFTVKVNP